MNIINRHNVRIFGKGKKPILFAHGYGCSQNMWRLVAPAFEQDHQVILFDWVGSGDSDTSAYDRAKYSHLQGYADDLVEICREFELKDVIFVGHSVSSMIGTLAAIRAPECFGRLVMIGPSPCYIDHGDYIGGFTREKMEGLLQMLQGNYTAWAEAIAPVVMGNVERPELGVELTQSFCRTKPEVAQHFAQVTFLSDNRKDLTKLRVPSVILQCRDDAIAPEPVGRYLHRMLRDSELMLMNATGHCPHMSAPEETIDAIRRYLSARAAA